jgi:hypothetical protein
MIEAPILIGVGVLANVVGTAFYIGRTLRGENKPNRMSFLMWSIAPLIGAIASFTQGVTWPAVPILFSALCPFAVLLASYVNQNAYWKLTSFDYLCGVLSALALILWWLTNVANVAIFFAILSDVIAGYPTIVKAWRHPETESSGGYTGSMFSVLMGLLVAERLDFASFAFPIYLICNNTVIIAGICRGRLRKSG